MQTADLWQIIETKTIAAKHISWILYLFVYHLPIFIFPLFSPV